MKLPKDKNKSVEDGQGNIKKPTGEKNTNDNKKLDKISKKGDIPEKKSKWL